MNLIIVESPTKAKTLGRFLGKDFKVEATMGHIKDLPKSKLGVDIENGFEPDYVRVHKKNDTVKKLQKEAKRADTIFLASDPDREGEAIAKHVMEELDHKKVVRIVFHEITKEAVEEAMQNPRKIDNCLVDAQVARRVLDRLVGYKLSPLLWRKVRRGLSAGRVQTVAVRLIVEREREREAFKAEEYWEIKVDVKTAKGEVFSVELKKVGGKPVKISDKKAADLLVRDLNKSKYKVFNVERKEVRKRPYPPYTTSTLTQAASNLMGWSSKKTMSIAQRLYEEGLITYHRTDSFNLSQSAVAAGRGYIEKNFGDKYLPEKPLFYKTKSKGAQEAHEAIRPTNPSRDAVDSWPMKGSFASDARKLYDLIWKRFMACQMSDAVYDQTKIDVVATGNKEYGLRATGQIMKFDGWRRIIGNVYEDNPRLPEVQKDDPLDLVKVNAEQKFTQPPARYNEASLIKTLEKLGIGRPSTYAPIISTIQERNYVEKEEGRFIPTIIGKTVNDFLLQNFPDVFDYSFTADMERELDEIAEGEKQWKKVIGDFWNPLEGKLENVQEKAERVKIETEKLGKKCPKCKEGELVIRVGRFGKFVSCSRFPDCDYTDKYLDKTGMKCPECGKGDVIVKKTKKGRKFFGCSRYPDCKFASWKEPRQNTKPSSSS